MEEVIASVLSTSASAVVGRTFTHPLDTLRTRATAGLTALPPSTIDGHKSFTNTLRGLYRGWSVVVRFSIPGLSVFLGGYDAAKYTLDKYTTLKKKLAHIIFAPMELFKTVYQTSPIIKGIKAPSLTSLIGEVYKLDGLKGVYRGGFLGLAIYAPHNILYFGTYEKFKSMLASRRNLTDLSKLNGFEFVLASSGATAIGAILTHPIQVIQTRYQLANTQTSATAATLGDQKPFKRINLGPLVKNMYSTGGFRIFYQGIIMRICWMAPNTALSMTLYELFKPKISSYLTSSGLLTNNNSNQHKLN
ncbi:mitochondrial carrier [Conidiobolus coronatus NRRL 28638]|uniref:Mitochondrial carrier n=1 Tax=Conidiobolus coronatus (strain ATCC 28846 / CBS 209.66 / NRRL 28638) TaxID=796925 RepID=A0A137NT15_CONC2|nr:mitochondrial carrier [Conidiobolus coronatus NRRL 28638]|eukprot:KXN65848.1 mitochondrial carrier [Conidiobolus coronatus NRRL 28638]